MAAYWTTSQIVNQAAGELGLNKYSTVVDTVDQSVLLLSLLNSCGNDLITYYPWEQLVKEWVFTTTAVDFVVVPSDLRYFTNQTQWDRTNHWPLLGPKSPSEWAWLKGSFVASLPRLRYRILGDQLRWYPTPSAGLSIAMEYISSNWLTSASIPTNLAVLDTDIIQFDPWLMIKFVKQRFSELKGLDNAGSLTADFIRTFSTLTGKDTGAQILSLSPSRDTPYLTMQSIPDGNWNV